MKSPSLLPIPLRKDPPGHRKRGPRRPAPRPAPAARRLPRVEPLEDRCLLSGVGLPLPPSGAAAAYAKLPVSFEPNRGQADPAAQFLARGSGYSVLLGPAEAVVRLNGASGLPGVSLRFDLLGADPAAAGTALDPLPGVVNYLGGSDPSAWLTGVPTFGRVQFDDVLDGIDLTYYGDQQQLEYDLTVNPGADPSAVRFRVSGADSLALDGAGNLVLHTAGGDVVEQAPVAYQEADGRRVQVAAGFTLDGDVVGFLVGPYDTGRPLVIDPVLSYSSLLSSGFFDQANAVAVGADGSAYVTGRAGAPFPGFGAAGFPVTAGAFQTTRGGGDDAFVAKFSPDGTHLVYATYLGGSGTDFGTGIAVDANGDAFVTGNTSSANFPGTGGSAIQSALHGTQNAFVAELNPSGTGLLWSTYLGGSGSDYANGLALDGQGGVYVTGRTTSTDFPTTAGAFQPAAHGTLGMSGDAFVARIAPGGGSLAYSTLLGGAGDDTGSGIAVDGLGDAFVAGSTTSADFPTTAGPLSAFRGFQDAFLAEVNPTGTALVRSALLGGTRGDNEANAVALDSQGNVYLVGGTAASDFPTTPGAFQRNFADSDSSPSGKDAWVAKITPSVGFQIAYATYLGGTGYDTGTGIAVDAAGNAFVTGQTSSANFPVANPITAPGYQGNALAGVLDAFVTELNAAGSQVVYSSYLGGNGFDRGTAIAVDALGDAYVVGIAGSSTFPLVNPVQKNLPFFSAAGFVARVGAVAAQPPVENPPTLPVSLPPTNPGSSSGTGSSPAVSFPGNAANALASAPVGSAASPPAASQEANPALATVALDLTRAGAAVLPGGPAEQAAAVFLPQTLLASAGGSPTRGVIAGKVFEDRNNNGIQEPGELPIAGQTVYLEVRVHGNPESKRLQTTTNDKGEYVFRDLPLDAVFRVTQRVEPGRLEQVYPPNEAGHHVELTPLKPIADGKDFGTALLAPRRPIVRPMVGDPTPELSPAPDGPQGRLPEEGEEMPLQKRADGRQSRAAGSSWGVWAFACAVAAPVLAVGRRRAAACRS